MSSLSYLVRLQLYAGFSVIFVLEVISAWNMTPCSLVEYGGDKILRRVGNPLTRPEGNDLERNNFQFSVYMTPGR
jgi:hypothetical protein